MKTVNIGILAHVDAGKTSLTERLLFEAGVIDHVGSVDKGSTQTDSLELERRRGITIQSAVVSFTLGDLKVNLIDTPGHSDFVSEVERALRVLDGAILVVSAVEGVQAQTRVLMRTLTKLRIPVLVFANKIDRVGARFGELLAEIRDRLGPTGFALDSDTDLWELLAANNDSYLDDRVQLDHRREFVRQTQQALVCPVFFGSAITGKGVDDLVRGMKEFLPSSEPRDGLRATVFKIERGRAGEKIAYVRLHSGTLHPRESIPFYRRDRGGEVVSLSGRVTAVRVFDEGAATVERGAIAGDIAKVLGLKDIQIGDQLGSPEKLPTQGFFAPPTLETVVRARAGGLYAALQRLAEQDPFINVRRNDHEISVCLYGEVQKEVLKAMLAETYGLDVEFEQTKTILVEKPAGVGEAFEEMGPHNHFYATIGLRIEPSAPGTGVTYKLAVELGSLPIAFHRAIEETVRKTLQHGLHGWEVIDCAVTLTRTAYCSVMSTAGDFRSLTALVVMDALKQAGTRMHEPINQFDLEVPMDSISGVLLKLAELRGVPGEPVVRGSTYVIRGTIPASQVHEFEQRLPALTQGEGVFLSGFHGYRPSHTA